MRSCERRSFDAATIFIAFVICCVDFTARIRRRISISDGIHRSHSSSCLRGYFGSSWLRCARLSRRLELRPELLQRPVQFVAQRIIELLLAGDGSQNPGMARFEEAVELLLVRA